MEKSKVIEKLFIDILTYLYLLLPLIYLFQKRKKRDATILAVYGLVFFLLLVFFYHIPEKLNPIYNTVFTFLEYSFFTSLFYLNLSNKRYKRIILILSSLFATFQVIHLFFFQNYRMDSVPIGVESILIFIYIFFFFLENLNNTKQEFIYNHHCFWISVGLLVYLGGSFFINILADTLSNEEVVKYWFLNYIADIFKTLLFSISLILVSKKKNALSSRSQNIPYLDLI